MYLILFCLGFPLWSFLVLPTFLPNNILLQSIIFYSIGWRNSSECIVLLPPSGSLVGWARWWAKNVSTTMPKGICFYARAFRRRHYGVANFCLANSWSFRCGCTGILRVDFHIGSHYHLVCLIPNTFYVLINRIILWISSLYSWPIQNTSEIHA